MDEAVEADRVVVIDDGKVLLDGTPHAVFAKEDILRKAGLTVPQSVALMHALQAQGIEVPEAVLTVDECVAVLEKLLREVDA
jgi:energy-coupling factor transport system ATP-binding protein